MNVSRFIVLLFYVMMPFEAFAEMPESADSIINVTANGVEFNMIRVRGGSFVMGATHGLAADAYQDEKPTHKVTLSDFYLGLLEVTQALWTAVMGNTLSDQRDLANSSWGLYGVGDDFPMYYVSWSDCQRFMLRLDSLTGLHFRLPTEAEWEYAARGGRLAKPLRYCGSDSPDSVSWHFNNRLKFASPVGVKAPNALGFYDMSGNVWEWCADWYAPYTRAAMKNPSGPSHGCKRVLRGGAWYFLPRACRISCRYPCSPEYRDCHFGFRLAM